MALESDYTRHTRALNTVNTSKPPSKAMHSKQCIISKATTCPPSCPGPFTPKPKPKDNRVDSAISSTIIPQHQFSQSTTSLHTLALSCAADVLVNANAGERNSECAAGEVSEPVITDMTFDLRTTKGTQDFLSWSAQVGPNSFKVKKLTLIHWTAWWGFGANNWTHASDSTIFTRIGDGLVATRSVWTPKQETCNCPVLALLTQRDATFAPAEYRAILSVTDFVKSLYGSAKSKTLSNVGVLFAEMLDAHSQLLVQQYLVAGGMCGKCEMPMLYLCGSKSSRISGYDGDVVFSAMGAA